MSIGLYFDHHVPRIVAEQLRKRDVDVVTAAGVHPNLLPDDLLFERSVRMGRVFVSQDQDFHAIAARWQQESRPVPGLAYFPQVGLDIGRIVKDLEIIAKTQDEGEMLSQVHYLPF
ncbi:MAG: DUF5615 family PIN-like protein [Dehalococcoidia bacterium]